MKCFLILVTVLAVVSSNVHADSSDKRPKKTDIRNKNVNIIVNMDPKMVAAELWKVIKDHLSSSTPQAAAKTVKEIENAITPMLTPTRRGAKAPVARVAGELEGITRRLLARDSPGIDPVKLELKTKEVSTDLMSSLKLMSDGEQPNNLKTSPKKGVVKGTFRQPSNYVVLPIRIKKSDLAKALAEV